MVSLAAKNWVVPLQIGSVEALMLGIHDAVIRDKWVEFTRRYEAIRLRTDLSPLYKPPNSLVSKAPFGPKRNSSCVLQREADYENFVEYCKRCKTLKVYETTSSLSLRLPKFQDFSIDLILPLDLQ